MLLVINVDLDYAIAMRHIVARFREPFVSGGWPEHIKLFGRELNFTFLAHRALIALESERKLATGTAQSNLQTILSDGEITLLNISVRKLSELCGQCADKELPLDFTMRIFRRHAIFSRR